MAAAIGGRGENPQTVRNLTLSPALTVPSMDAKNAPPQAPPWYPPTQLCVEVWKAGPHPSPAPGGPVFPFCFPFLFSCYAPVMRRRHELSNGTIESGLAAAGGAAGARLSSALQ